MSAPVTIAPLDLDARKTLWSIFLIGVIGPEVFIVQPGFVQGLVGYLGFDDQGAGYTASAEMFGLAATTVLMTFIAHRLNWRKVILVSVLIMFFANLASAFVSDLNVFIALRFIAGLGAGSLVSLGFAAIGLTSNPDRNFGLMITWVLVYGALVLWLMPLTYELTGMTGVLLFFALFPLSALPFIKYLPASGEDQVQSDIVETSLPRQFKIMALVAMLAYFTAQGVVWAYLFLIGTAGGLSEQAVANGLMLSQFAGIGGALLAAVLADRFGRSIPLAVGILCGAACLYFIVGKFSFLVYATTVIAYNFLWNVTHPYLMAAMSSFDARGRVVVYAVAMQMIGLAIGPGIAATVISGGTYVNVNILGAVLFVLSFVLVLPPVMAQLRASR